MTKGKFGLSLAAVAVIAFGFAALRQPQSVLLVVGFALLAERDEWLNRQAMQALGGRAAFRCTTPDYLPLVGPVADAAAFNRVYAPLARDATEHLTTPAPWVPGLYVNTGHGSRGLITAPLSGEVIAACVEGEPAPLPRSLLNGLHPSRFLLRNLVRRKTPRPAGATEA